MQPLPQPPHQSPHQPAHRHLSVDVLRGLVMWLMLFVNDIASVDAVPKWLKHFHPDLANGMTFVDIVFPAFLFVVGMSVPLAMASRQAKGSAALSTTAHVLWRTAALLTMGVFMVNMTGWGWWPVFTLLALILAFVSCSTLPNLATHLLRTTGFLALALLWWTYPSYYPGKEMTTQWWGILGLIGWAYLIACLAFALTRQGNRTGLVAIASLLIALFFASSQKQFADLASLPALNLLTPWIDLGSMFGTHGAIAVLGVLLGTSLTHPQSHLQRLRLAATLALTSLLAGLLTYPSFGVNKNIATPTWALWSAAATTTLWAAIYLLTDILNLAKTRPAKWTAEVGSAALLIYLLQPLWFRTFSLLHIPYNALAPTLWTGLLRGAIAATLLSACAVALSRRGIRLRV